MHVSDKIIYTLLLLVSLTFIGMIIHSWRIILYPYLIVIGLVILCGMWKSIKIDPRKVWIPVTVSVVYLILYGYLDILSRDSKIVGDYYIFGMTPTVALFMLGILPFAVIVCLLYAITFTNEKPLAKNHGRNEVGK